jgi:SAM-dependent methyltransferase
MDADFWNQRYAREDYVYGTAPNDFVSECLPRIPPGPVLCLAEGEGRNAVYLAAQGRAVTAVDQSEVALAKAHQLAATHGVRIETVAADLAVYPIAPGAWAGIVATWLHLPPGLRRAVLGQVVCGLQPGGCFMFEAYTPAQLAYNTGGPRDAQLLPTAVQLREELVGLEFEVLREIERDVREGTAHGGRAAVVQVLARRP